MTKQFFRQAWTMMKQQRLFTGMYIAGTAVSIALAMILFIIFYIKLGPVYPEYNRHRMLVIENTSCKQVNKMCTTTYKSSISAKFANLIKKEAKSLERIALLGWQKKHISTEDGNISIEEPGHKTNCDFWKVFSFRFIDGRPFAPEEMHENVIIISRTIALKFFATEKVVGKILKIDNNAHRIVGVVEETGGCSTITSGNYWQPISPNIANEHEFTGNFHAYMTSNNKEELKKEIENIFNRWAQEQPKEYTYTIDIEDFWQTALDCEKEDTPFDAMGKYLYILLAFLFIPALNLNGMISSRMEERMEEIGVRKAYGATNRLILSQVLWENLLLTFIGSTIGLTLSYIVVSSCESWISTIFDTNIYSHLPRSINFTMLFNPTVLCTTLAITALLNITSALVPTLLALKKNIIESLYNRR